MIMDKRLPILLCLCLPAVVVAGMYKWEDENGKVHYTDQPPTEDAEELSLPPINSYTPPESPEIRPEDQEAVAEPGVDPEPTDPANITYDKLTITSPKMNETIRNNDGDVPVAYTLEPGGLKPDHKIRLVLDGRAQEGTSSLTNVARGSHTVKVQIVDAKGIPQKISPGVIFHLHREADGKKTTDSTKPDDNSEAYTPSSGDADHSAEENDGIVQDSDGSSYDPTNITDPDDDRDSVYDPTTSGHGAGTSYDPSSSGYGSTTSPSSGTYNAPSGTYTPNYNQK